MLSSLAAWLLDPAGLTPHGFCLLWEPGLVWTYALADAAIGIAYCSIPITLAVLARRRRDLVFRPIFWLFAAFILLCGATHWLDVVTLWVPAYGVEAVVKALTATVSLATAIVLWRLLPNALVLPSAAQLREANAALAASEARHRAAYERSPVPLYTVDRHDIVTSVSESWLGLLGYSRERAIGRPIGEFRTADSATMDDAQRARLLAEGEILDQERRFLRSDGGVVEALVSARVDDRENADAIVCVLIDVTARRRAEAALRASEERLAQSQKMEAIGQLTGGIAHDFNNMLQGIAGCLERMALNLRQGRTTQIDRYITAAQQSVNRAANLTHRMLAFARRQSLQPEAVEVDTMMTGMGELIGRTLGPSIALQLERHDGIWRARCDANQLESALLNLAINARDAMPEGGTLTIASADRTLTWADLSDQPDAAPGDYIELAVTDTGTGIDPDILPRVFEPFFTTKPIGHGTGLGLSQVYGFVRQSGGFVRIESQLGRGTAIRLFIPRDRGEHTEPQAPRRPPIAATIAPSTFERDSEAAGRTVLVVDDEEGVRSLIVEALSDIGYRVIEAGDGRTALQMLQSSAALDLLITDIGLPGMDGRQLAAAARDLRPALPVLLISGYDWTPQSPGLSATDLGMLRKPFSLEEICERVAALLTSVQVASSS
jgi:PAS domain S-box-containing protein